MKTRELLKKYEGVLEPWQIDMAIGRIRAMRMPRAQWEDLMQDLAILILEFEFDPAKSNGATEETAIYAAITLHLRFAMRTADRREQAYKRYLRSIGIDTNAVYEEYEPSYELDADLEADLHMVCATLSPFDQAVAKYLADGMNRLEIAQILDCDWKTINKAIGRIKERFEDGCIDQESL